MKKHGLSLLMLLLIFLSCEEDREYESYEVAIPLTMDLTEFRESVRLAAPKDVEESGKIYTYKNFIFINDHMKGILVIDNTNFTPEKISYIEIPQNTDFAVKDDVLYANSAMDIVTFDISDIHAIKVQERLENVFEHYPTLPINAQYTDYGDFDQNTSVIIGFTTELRRRAVDHSLVIENGQDGSFFSGTGTGGSMARFNITGDYLYAVGRNDLSVFDISSLSNIKKLTSEYVGWQIETIFNKEQYLYLGSSAGMYIYSIENPSSPEYVSAIQHVMGCDPVVVEDDLAYVTIRGGNECGQNFNQLEIIDIADKTNPQLLKVYEMDHPYGLGVRYGKLFVCDGDSGLKVYDTTDSPDLVLTNHFQEVHAYDVIPEEDVLIMIGNNILTQYSYKNNEITFISSMDLE